MQIYHHLQFDDILCNVYSLCIARHTRWHVLLFAMTLKHNLDALKWWKRLEITCRSFRSTEWPIENFLLPPRHTEHRTNNSGILLGLHRSTPWHTRHFVLSFFATISFFTLANGFESSSSVFFSSLTFGSLTSSSSDDDESPELESLESCEK